VDLQISRILEALERREMLESSLVVVLSDHGEEFLDHVESERGQGEDPRDLYGIGHGHSLYDELLHVPLLWMGGAAPAGQRIAEQFSLLDLMPTLSPRRLGSTESTAAPGCATASASRWSRRPNRSPTASIASPCSATARS
jgi:arylsulfatase A-like enzyme